VKIAGVILAAAVVFLTATVASEWNGPAGPPRPIAVETVPPATPGVPTQQPPTTQPKPVTKPVVGNAPTTVTPVQPITPVVTPIGPGLNPPPIGPPSVGGGPPPAPPPSGAPSPGPSGSPGGKGHHGKGKGVKKPHGHHGSCDANPQGPNAKPRGKSGEHHGKAGEHGNHYGLDKHDGRATPSGLAKRHRPHC
jgi:hypothetical protein